MKRHLAIAFVIAFAAACGSDANNETPDSTLDAGVSSGDSGQGDVSLGVDAGEQPDDAGISPDARDFVDAGTSDSGMTAEDAGSIDAGGADGGMDAGMSDASMDAGVDMAPPSNDPFDPGSCSGTPWSEADALARLGGSDAEVLDQATVMTRSRTCDANGCGPWSDAEPTVLSFLTWSGGVTTRYTQLQIDTTLVLWDDNGAPKLSVRHDTHIDRYPDDHGEGITFGFPAEVIPYPYIRAWNVNPENQYDYRDLENYLGRDARLFVSPGCARFLSVYPGMGPDVTTEYAALYRF